MFLCKGRKILERSPSFFFNFQNFSNLETAIFFLSFQNKKFVNFYIFFSFKFPKLKFFGNFYISFFSSFFFKFPKLKFWKLLYQSCFFLFFLFLKLKLKLKLKISLFNKAIIVIVSVNLPMVNIYEFCKKDILIQPPGKPREQHLGDVRPKKFELQKIS